MPTPLSTFWCNSGHTSVGGTTFKLDPAPVETMKCSVAPVAHGCWARGAAWLQSGYLRRIGNIRRIFPNSAILRYAGVTCTEIFLHSRSVTCPNGPISKFRGRLNPRKSPGYGQFQNYGIPWVPLDLDWIFYRYVTPYWTSDVIIHIWYVIGFWL